MITANVIKNRPLKYGLWLIGCPMCGLSWLLMCGAKKDGCGEYHTQPGYI